MLVVLMWTLCSPLLIFFQSGAAMSWRPNQGSLLILSHSEVRTILSSKLTKSVLTSDLFWDISYAFLQPVIAPQRTIIDVGDHKFLFMPGHVEGIGTAVKIVSSRDSIPASTVVLDEVTGNIKAIVNARSMTAVRTAVGVCKCISSRSSFYSGQEPQARFSQRWY
jgi:hypothetical protein